MHSEYVVKVASPRSHAASSYYGSAHMASSLPSSTPIGPIDPLHRVSPSGHASSAAAEPIDAASAARPGGHAEVQPSAAVVPPVVHPSAPS